MRHVLRLAASAALVCLLTAPSLADEVVLKNGGLIRGTIVEENKTEVVVRLEDGNTLTLSRKTIKSLRRTEGTHRSTSRPATDARLGTPALLRWKFQPGVELKYRSSSRWTFGMVGGGDAPGQETTTELRLKPVSVEADEARVELTIDRVRERREVKDGKDDVLDSSNKDPARQPEGQGMIAKPIVVRLTTRGEVLEIVRFNGMAVKDLSVKDQRGMERLVGENLVRITLMGMLGSLPEGKAVPEASTWKESATVVGPGSGDLTFRVLNRVQRIVAGTATIEQRGHVETTGIKRSQLKNTKIRGELRFSSTRGRLLRARQTVSFESVPNSDKPDAAIRVEMRTEVELVP